MGYKIFVSHAKTLASIDRDISMAEKSGKHNVVAAEDSVSQIVRDLMHNNAFDFQSGREGCESFPSLAKISLKGLTTEIFFLVKGVAKDMGSHVFLN